jgi:hypothetical protein
MWKTRTGLLPLALHKGMQSMSQPNPSPASTELPPPTEIPQTLSSRIKAAGQLAAKQAQRTTIATITLPGGYRALGKHLYSTKAHRNEFPDIYKQFEQLAAELKALKEQAAARPASEGFAAKAKAGMAAAKDMAQSKALELKTNHLFTELGKAAFGKFGVESGPEEISRPVADAQARLATFDSEISALSHPRPDQLLSPKRIAVACLIIVALFSTYFLFGRKSPQVSQQHQFPVASFHDQLLGDWVNKQGGLITFRTDKVVTGGKRYKPEMFPYSVDEAKKVATIQSGPNLTISVEMEDEKLYTMLHDPKKPNSSTVIIFHRPDIDIDKDAMDWDKQMANVDRQTANWNKSDSDPNLWLKDDQSKTAPASSGMPPKESWETVGDYYKRLNPTNNRAIKSMIDGGTYTREAADNIRRMEDASK